MLILKEIPGELTPVKAISSLMSRGFSVTTIFVFFVIVKSRFCIRFNAVFEAGKIYWKCNLYHRLNIARCIGHSYF